MSPPKRVGPDAANAEAQPATNPNRTSEFSNSSRQVQWWTVHEYVQPYLAAAGYVGDDQAAYAYRRALSWPTVGTPEWCALDDQDPVKIAAVYDAAQHWALRVDSCQEARCQASRDVSAADDWSRVATKMVQRESFYAARPWLKRVAS